MTVASVLIKERNRNELMPEEWHENWRKMGSSTYFASTVPECQIVILIRVSSFQNRLDHVFDIILISLQLTASFLIINSIFQERF